MRKAQPAHAFDDLHCLVLPSLQGVRTPVPGVLEVGIGYFGPAMCGVVGFGVERRVATGRGRSGPPTLCSCPAKCPGCRPSRSTAWPGSGRLRTRSRGRPGADPGLVPVCHKSLPAPCLSPLTRGSDATAALVIQIHSNTPILQRSASGRLSSAALPARRYPKGRGIFCCSTRSRKLRVSLAVVPVAGRVASDGSRPVFAQFSPGVAGQRFVFRPSAASAGKTKNRGFLPVGRRSAQWIR